MADVLIAGCGYVGCELARRLEARGHRVRGLRRHVESLPCSVEAICADLTCPHELVAALPSDIDVVFYLAAAQETTDEAYAAIYVSGLRNLIDAISARGARPHRLFVATSTAVYGQRSGEWVDERSTAEPTRFTGRRLLQSEMVAREAPFPGTVVRFGGIYGPGRCGLLERVARGEVAVTPAPHYTNRIHRDDCAAVFDHLMELDEPEGLYLGVDSAPEDLAVIARWLAERLGAPPPPPATEQRRIPGSKRCRNTRLLGSGYQFLYPSFREGYQSLLAAPAH